MRVSPFRNLWITGYLLLPTAYRSLSRLSSALSAKASALCSFLLDLVGISFAFLAARKLTARDRFAVPPLALRIAFVVRLYLFGLA